jgi:hypothetical protein
MAAVCVEETRYGQFCCGTRSRSHTRGQRAVYTYVVVGWWDRRCAREGLGKYRYICGIATCVVAEAYICGHGAATCGPRGALGSTDTWPHTHGEGCTRRARGRSEQRATDVSKNIGVFCGYALVSAVSELYICGQRAAHMVGERWECTWSTWDLLAQGGRWGWLDFDRRG